MKSRCLLVLPLVAAAMPAGADTLQQALIETYRSNPSLTAQRAQLRALDEGVEIVRADNRLNLSATAGLTQGFNGIGTFNSNGRALTGALNLNYPLFNGGRVRNAIRGADARVVAGRADLRSTEGDVFTQAVGAYEDVIRDAKIVELNQLEVRVLETNLQASRDRFEAGDLTRTDVAQSEARLAGARSQLALAQGNLTASREGYIRIVGSSPATLADPPPLPPLPASPDAATEVALRNNPGIQSATAATQASRYDVSVARAARLPTIGIGAGTNYNNYLGTLNNAVGAPSNVKLDQSQTNSTVGFTGTIPLYQGGGVAARVRQAQAYESQAIEQGVAVERQVIANTRAAYASYQAAREAIASSQTAVDANRLALEGVQAENGVGSRTILEVLNAQQELLNSQVALVTARRDLYVAGFALLNAMGRAEMADLNLEGGALYDPTQHYKAIKGGWSDWRDDPTPTAQATHTYGPTVANHP